MTTLYLLRHAKSSWDDPAMADVARPLNARGRAAAQRLRNHLQTAGVGVDLVLCSPARRTRETWDAVRTGLDAEPEVRFVERIYEASTVDLLTVLRDVPEGTGRVLLIGHNPGLSELTRRLDPTVADPMLPTGAFVTIRIDGRWSELGTVAQHVDSVVRPRDLAS